MLAREADSKAINLKDRMTPNPLCMGTGAVNSTVQYSKCGRGSQTSALASEPQAHEGAQRAQ